MNIAVETLRRDGIYKLPGTLDATAIQLYIHGCPAYANHVRQGKTNWISPGDHPWTCYDMSDAVRAPGLLEAGVAVMDVAAAYLEAEPVLYSLNIFHCEPNAQPKLDIQGWHRDADDVRFLALFAYLTDVLTDDDGPHRFVAGSHVDHVVGSHQVSVYGPAGTMFLADTRGLHYGEVPRTRRRTLAWARWGVTRPPPSYVWDGLQPTSRELIGSRYPSDPRIQEAISLVVV